MNNTLKERLDLFSANAQSMKKEFVLQEPLIKRLAALLYAAENLTVDCDAIRECRELIRMNTGIFSNFRGNLAVCIATLLSLSDNRAEQLSGTLEVYDIMKEMKFRASDYLVVAAYQIAQAADKPNYRQVVERAKAFYDGMKKNHWFYTGKDDYIFAAMLGLSDINVQTGIERMEQLHQRLKPKFSSGNGVQALTQVLALGGETNETVIRLLNLNQLFRERNLRLDKEDTLSSLGILSLIPVDTGTIATDVLEAYDFLRAQKDFGMWSVSKQELVLFSAAITAFAYLDDVKSGVITTALSTSITNIILAQQMVFSAAAASSAAAAASSLSSNG